MKIGIDLKTYDVLYYKQSDDKCSRCRNKFKANEVPLLVWPENRDYMLQFCQTCAESVVVAEASE